MIVAGQRDGRSHEAHTEANGDERTQVMIKERAGQDGCAARDLNPEPAD